ncbi:EAL domain-containing protein [Aphanothece sacrum]|uniref:Diguanylate cyclase n=1 Tax=Aphanothece sacrum FPU1 TaxID=1920663 RepID=A0A401IEU9_APHSA|nr:EAL domain-containing protein [Aphanothece sacrum]GBF79788.1 diguanylate cyclase [Aphanothece sacrum FPU1]GBF84800.1 diguanylate cyclase [Aphanothece sacrum FPU3]
MIPPSRAINHILVIEDKKYQQTISLEKDVYSLGRHPKSSIVIYSEQVSRLHATVMRRKSSDNYEYSYWILDGDLDGNKSRNGIYINGQKCIVQELKHGDLINLGGEVKATYHAVNDSSNILIKITSLKTINIQENTISATASPIYNSLSSPGFSQGLLMISESHLENSHIQSLIVKRTINGQECQDTLTKLPNRKLFTEYLSIALKNAKQSHSLMAVVLIKINNFDNINQTFGYLIGDNLLVWLAEHLKSTLRSSDIVSRWNKDQFAILLSKVNYLDNVHKISQRLLNSLCQSLEISGHQIQLDSSLGLAIYPQDGQIYKILIKKAEFSLLVHKQKKQNNIPSKSLKIDPKNTKLLKAKMVLEKAVKQDQFLLYYQPQIKIQTGEISGVEALIRWQHPTFGKILPQNFIPLAEQTNVIKSLDQWVLKNACIQNKIWQSIGLPCLPISVNLSPQQLINPDCVNMIAQILKETELEPRWLELEITEKALLLNPAKAQEVLLELRKMGIHLSMDDFGIGYSCLNHLNDFPFETIKISQLRVQNLSNIPKSIALISAAITLGNSLDLRVVAEGVETQTQLDLLQSLDCKEMQGYLFSEPLTEGDVTELLLLEQGKL